MTHHLFRSITVCAALALLLTVAQAQAAGVSVDDASWADTNEATQKYKSGKRAYDHGKLEEALARFRDSYDTVASPNSHLMIARVLIELKRYVAAYNELALVIAEAEAVKKKPEKYTKTAGAARALRKELEEKLGFIEVEVPAKVTIKGEEVPPDQWGTPIPVVAGNTAADIEMADGTKRTEEMTVEAGQTKKLDLVPTAEAAPVAVPGEAKACPAQERPVAEKGTVKQTTVGLAAGGIGVTGLVTFAIFGILDNKKYSDLESECVGDTCPANLADDAEKGRSFQALANVGLGVGVVGIGTGAVLLLTAPRTKTAAERRHPRVVVGPSSIAIKGRF